MMCCKRGSVVKSTLSLTFQLFFIFKQIVNIVQVILIDLKEVLWLLLLVQLLLICADWSCWCISCVVLRTVSENMRWLHIMSRIYILFFREKFHNRQICLSQSQFSETFTPNCYFCKWEKWWQVLVDHVTIKWDTWDVSHETRPGGRDVTPQWWGLGDAR